MNEERFHTNCHCDTCIEHQSVDIKETKEQKYRRLHHDRATISKWRSRGLLLREGETYEMIYDKVYSATNCELCNLSFKNNTPEMDHCHISGYFRKVLCRSCNASYLIGPKKSYSNNKSGHKHIGYRETRGYYTVCKRVNGKVLGQREFKNKIDAISYKFIMILKIKSNYYTNGKCSATTTNLSSETLT